MNPDLPENEYFSDPCEVPSLNSSTAKVLIAQSPAHAWQAHPRLGGKGAAVEEADDQDALDHGVALHSLLLGTGARIVRIDADSFRTKAAQELRDDARNSGRVPMIARKFDDIQCTAAALHERFAEFDFDPAAGTKEASVFWGEQPQTGTLEVQCRGRIDHLDLANLRIWDLKSCRSAHPRAVQRHVYEYGYDIQRAAYVSACDHIWPEVAGRWDFWFMFFETSPPFACFPCRLDGTFRELGNRRWRRAVDIWSACTTTGVWPGYSRGGVAELPAPEWALNRDMEEQVLAHAAGGGGSADWIEGQ
jgi:hypothetical protein